MSQIKHIWFDFSGTLASTIPVEHNKLIHRTYSEAVKKPISEDLISEFKDLYQKHKSVSTVFTNHLGLPQGYWAMVVDAADPKTLVRLADPKIPFILGQIRKLVPISIFSNMRMDKLLPAVGLDASLFTHILSGADIKNPKPALDGFYKIIELSELPPKNILFIGDDVEKEVIPVKKVGMLAGIIWTSSKKADYSFKNFEEILNILE